MDLKIAPAPEGQDGPEYSKLGSTLVTEEVPQRPISRDGQHIQRHAQLADLNVNELDHNYDVDPDDYPFANIDSAQELFSAVLYHEHLSKDQNFGAETTIECLKVDQKDALWKSLDEDGLRATVKDASELWNNVPALSTGSQAAEHTSKREALVLFVPLIPATSDSSYKYSLPMTRSSVVHLFEALRLDAAFLSNMLGRPDYWAPQTLWDQEGSTFRGCDFYCQHPRWNLNVQGAPLSVYCKYDAQRDLTVYIISHKEGDTVIQSLRKLLDITVRHKARNHVANLLLDSPLDLQVMISNLNFESSKWHVAKFRRLQWDVVNKVDDHLAGIEARDRSKLAELLKKLQIVAQNVDSHLANADVFLYSAQAIRDTCMRLNVSRNPMIRQRTLDMIRHVITSMDKQKMWFVNYKGRKEATMNLLFHITTQQDALNNIELASDMKKDSTSMNAIAALTMVFLPGTFTATLLSTEIFQAGPGWTQFQVTGLLWLWIVVTVPITVVTMTCWWLYKNKKSNMIEPVKLWFKDDSKSYGS
ncbi:hypothetical protein BU24DRAFT_423038 [Aaosphaeria arxii CBS 175.79]|uniref:Cora-domain-containing protein n=1 Tax=Aaosphaeria arxii CBS 175.79 TaxID=1450172 RepID=A0A6A5XVK5_9PLEO|nr:uncharacterized protein BU24DRAFT_423038 [Aaosphaeria arxii CBS 175.79]KAF2016660.1 hypothetical protein BU24DRAFT_423038 [Aaosphaeria arxii CBS 175.79]